jgi:hypothetical protein
VESGHAAGDPEKRLIRRLNFTGILSCLYAIATGEYARARIAEYEALPFNGKKAYELIIRNVLIDDEGGRTMKADLGLSSQVDTHLEPPAKLVDAGDLSTYVGLEEIDGRVGLYRGGSSGLESPWTRRTDILVCPTLTDRNVGPT